MSTNQASIHVKVDAAIKRQSEDILSQIGISMSDLINMTLRRVIYERRIPFETTIASNDTLPECLNIKTKEELINLLNNRLQDPTESYLTAKQVEEALNLA